MVQIEANETGWRGSRDGWLAAAYESLVEAGVEAVRILPLAKRLGLSRTSFYWFFEDRDALLAALVGQWRDKNTGALTGQAALPAPGIVPAVLNVFDCWLDRSLFDSQFEFAVRSWALQSPAVAAEIEAADALRIGALAAMFVRHGYCDLAADVRARTIYLTQIGYISMNTIEETSLRMKRVPDYVEIFTGVAPDVRDLEAFFARHGVGPQAPRDDGPSGECR